MGPALQDIRVRAKLHIIKDLTVSFSIIGMIKTSLESTVVRDIALKIVNIGL
jgi:hypothetical protein